MPFSNFAKQKILHHIFRSETWTPPATVYLALFSTMPDADGAGGVEVTGGSYARQATAWGVYTGGYVTNSSNVIYTNMPQVDLVGAGFYTGVVDGDFIALTSFTLRPVPSGEDLLIAIGEMRFGSAA